LSALRFATNTILGEEASSTGDIPFGPTAGGGC
jgi:hypothetical protein